MRAVLIIRMCKLVFAGLGAGTLVVMGGLLWPVQAAMGGCLIAGGQCVVMWLLADDLWPRALPQVTGVFKIAALLLFCVHLGLTLYSFLPG